MTKREEEQKHQRKIEELHAQVEHEARELSQLESSKQQAIQERDNARKEKGTLEVQIAGLNAKIENLNSQVSAKQSGQEKRIASQNVKRGKIEKNIKVLESKLSQLTKHIQKKKAFVKDLAALERKHSKALTSYKNILADSESAKADLVKARKQAKQIIELSAKILSRAKEREADCQASENAISKARKKVIFHANRINEWNKSKGLKEIEINL